MTSITHFLVTRFNVREREEDRTPLNVDWLNSRFALFDRFCFPTVRGQSEQNFRWLVLFDSETPGSARTRIEEYARWPTFTPVFIPPGLEGGGRKAVLSQLDGHPEILLTTRLDNDDGICRTFVQQLHEHARVAQATVLSFPVGYVWHQDRVYRDRFIYNAFATLAEPAPVGEGAEFRTIYTGSHVKVGQLGGVIEVTSRPSWLQVVHGGNLENRRRGVRQPLSLLRESFDIDPDLIAAPENRLLLQFDKAYTAAVMAGRRCARAAYAQVLRSLAGLGAVRERSES